MLYRLAITFKALFQTYAFSFIETRQINYLNNLYYTFNKVRLINRVANDL